MKLVFADTSLFVALSSPRDQYHSAANDFATRYRGQILTTDFVLIEVANHFSRAQDHPAFITLIDGLHRGRRIIIPASRELFQHGVDLFMRRPDKDWSLTDCTSFVVMTDNDIKDVLTTDHHFEQAGFNNLLC